MWSSKDSRLSSLPMTLSVQIKVQFRINIVKSEMQSTYKWNVSLYFGDHVFDLDFVANLRFLSARCGPTKLVSTNGRNIPGWTGHFKSLAATTVDDKYIRNQIHSFKKMCGVKRLPLTVTLCSPEPGWVNKSTWTLTSPTLPSSTLGKSKKTQMN